MFVVARAALFLLGPRFPGAHHVFDWLALVTGLGLATVLFVNWYWIF